MKKNKSKTGLIFHIVLSILVWQFIFYIFLNMALTAMVEKSIFSDSISIIVVKYNLLWIVSNCVILLVVYLFNRRNTTEKADLPSVKIIVLICFYVLTFVVNIEKITSLIKYSGLVEIVCLVAHISIIYFLNNMLFKKFIEN